MASYSIEIKADVEAASARDVYEALAETFRRAAVGGELGVDAPEAVRRIKVKMPMTGADLLREWEGEDR